MTDRPDIDRRVVQLERMVEHQMQLIDFMASALGNVTCRVLVLQTLLHERGGLPPASVVEAKMQEIDLDATAEMELGPQQEEFRRVRRLIQERLPDEDGPPDA
jgi:hypothetical protein